MSNSKIRVRADRKTNLVSMLIDEEHSDHVQEVVLTAALSQKLGEELFRAGRICDVSDPAYKEKA